MWTRIGNYERYHKKHTGGTKHGENKQQELL